MVTKLQRTQYLWTHYSTTNPLRHYYKRRPYYWLWQKIEIPVKRAKNSCGSTSVVCSFTRSQCTVQVLYKNHVEFLQIKWSRDLLHCKPIPCNDYRNLPGYWSCKDYRVLKQPLKPCSMNWQFPVQITGTRATISMLLKQGKKCNQNRRKLYSVNSFPVMTTGISLCTNSTL